MPKQYEAMRDKFHGEGMDYDAAQAKAARIYNAKHPGNPVGRHSDMGQGRAYRKQKEEAKQREQPSVPGKRVTGSKDNEKSTVKTEEEFEAEHGTAKRLPTLEEILKQQREKKEKEKKKISSVIHPSRNRGEVMAGMLMNRKRNA